MLLALCLALSAGCAPEYNRSPTAGESESLRDVMQLTHNFDRAGEAYFSGDMHWIIFQAVPAAQQQYQMYVAPVQSGPQGITGIGTHIRISPEDSRNTCGFFSPDGNSIIFASTAGKEKLVSVFAKFDRALSDLLRHRFRETTEIYAKVDIDALREVAQPWPLEAA